MGKPLRAKRVSASHKYFVPVPVGLEEALQAEMLALSFKEIKAVRGGCFFTGDLEACYRANLWLRTASRVLRVVGQAPAVDRDQLHQGVQALPWEHWMRPEMTLAVRVRGGQQGQRDAVLSALRIKDAVVDRFREKLGRRPSVDKQAPDLEIHAWLEAGQCSLALNTSGPPLFMRGYRDRHGAAPLKETLAAGLIALSGWRAERPFYAPMCGTGTLPIEAALIAANRAPGLTRHQFALRNWPDFDAGLWNRLLREAKGAVRPITVPIIATDHSHETLQQARRNAARAEVAGAIDFRTESMDDFSPPEGEGLILLNPPYGERMGNEENLAELYRSIGNVFKQHGGGKDAYLFTIQGPLIKRIGLRTARRHKLFNGPLECRLLHFPLYSGAAPHQKDPSQPPGLRNPPSGDSSPGIDAG